MSAREEMLDRVRRARATAVAPQVPRAYRRDGEGESEPTTLVDLLVDRLVDYKAGVTRTPSEAAASAITAVLARQGAREAVVPQGFPEQWLPGDVDLRSDTPALAAAELDAIDAVLTTSALAIAETGTIVLDAGAGMGRRALSLVPDLHVLVVRVDDVVRGVPEAFARLDPIRPLTWISGPSATSDIELDRVEGVHGPRRLEVVLVDSDRSTGVKP